LRRLLTIVPLFLISLSCVDTDLNFPQKRDRLVVEGWVTDEMKAHWVKISLTTAFDDPLPEIPIEDAIVYIKDNLHGEGEGYLLTHIGGGRYESEVFQGIVGRYYYLEILLSDGNQITSVPETLMAVSPITSLEVGSFEDVDPITGDEIIVYFPIVTNQDPIEEVNYYRYKGFRNGTQLNAPRELIVLSDRFINGNLLQNEIPQLRYSLGEEMTIELHSISRGAYDFLELLRLQTTSSGTPSGTSPAPLFGNVRNQTNPDQKVLGFFGASAVSNATLIVED
jgi:hypothetical protein